MQSSFWDKHTFFLSRYVDMSDPVAEIIQEEVEEAQQEAASSSSAPPPTGFIYDRQLMQRCRMLTCPRSCFFFFCCSPHSVPHWSFDGSSRGICQQRVSVLMIVYLHQLTCHTHRLTLQERFFLCRSIGEECIQEDELMHLLEKKPEPCAYDGFEPSGRMHLAQVLYLVLSQDHPILTYICMYVCGIGSSQSCVCESSDSCGSQIQGLSTIASIAHS